MTFYKYNYKNDSEFSLLFKDLRKLVFLKI